MMVILSSQIMFPGRLRIAGFVFKMTNLGAMKSQFNSFNFTFTFHFILSTLPKKPNITALYRLQVKM